MCFFHKWSKWERYETTSLSYFYTIPCKQEKIMQRRECAKCGFTQDEFIANKTFVSLSKENIPSEIQQAQKAQQDAQLFRKPQR
jgi:Zn ribbon nucleic-acid-binding protein